MARWFAVESARGEADALAALRLAQARVDAGPGSRFARGALARMSAVLGLAIVAGVVGLAGAGLLLLPTGPATATATAVGTPGATAGATAPAPLYDADGVPFEVDGEPVLRGAAIETRAATGDPAPFLVAGWSTFDPQPTCAPSPVSCDSTSLVDAANRGATGGRITLHVDDGSGRLGAWSFSGAEEWAGGFVVLRVRATCTYGGSVCLFVDASLPPSALLPADPGRFGSDGVPRTIDGQPVLRGADIRARAAEARPAGQFGTAAFYVAGWLDALPARNDLVCRDPVRWDVAPCLRARLLDPGLGLTATSSDLVAEGTYLDEVGTPPWTSSRWPGGFVVLLVDGRVTDQVVRLRVLRIVGPDSADAAPRAPTPAYFASGGSMGWSGDGLITHIGEERVWTGSAVVEKLDAAGVAGGTGPESTVLAQGVVQRRPCDACAGGQMTVLVPPPAAKATTPVFPLLRPDGTWFEPSARMVWPAVPFRGTMVVEVRRFAGACPAGADCTDALEVVSVVAPSE